MWHQMMLYDELDVPEARFGYNLSPMAVLVKSEKRPWYDFVTKVLAIVGGTFSVVRQPLVSSLFYLCGRLIRVMVSWGPESRLYTSNSEAQYSLR